MGHTPGDEVQRVPEEGGPADLDGTPARGWSWQRFPTGELRGGVVNRHDRHQRSVPRGGLQGAVFGEFWSSRVDGYSELGAQRCSYSLQDWRDMVSWTWRREDRGITGQQTLSDAQGEVGTLADSD